MVWWPGSTGTVTFSVPLRTVDTPYDRLGDWMLAWCLVILAASVIVISLGAESRAEALA